MRSAACDPHAARLLLTRSIAMLDVVFILIGAAFLGSCILYAFACDHL